MKWLTVTPHLLLLVLLLAGVPLTWNGDLCVSDVMDLFPASPSCRRHWIVVVSFAVFKLVVFDGSVGGDVIDVVRFTSWSPGNCDGVVTDDAAGGVDLWSSGNCNKVQNHRWIPLITLTRTNNNNNKLPLWCHFQLDILEQTHLAGSVASEAPPSQRWSPQYIGTCSLIPPDESSAGMPGPLLPWQQVEEMTTYFQILIRNYYFDYDKL